MKRDNGEGKKKGLCYIGIHPSKKKVKQKKEKVEKRMVGVKEKGNYMEKEEEKGLKLIDKENTKYIRRKKGEIEKG